MLPAMNDAFWDTFVAEHWDVRPGLFRNQSTLAPTEDDLFEGLLRALGAIAASANIQSVGDFFINGRLVGPPEIMRFAPGDAGSLREYLKAVSERFEGQEVGIYIRNFHRYCQPLLPAARDFLRPLFSRIGLPACRTDAALFCGTYDVGPFGIHRDVGNAVFTFPVLGKKRFLVWEPDHFADDPLAVYRDPNPARYEAEGLALEGHPGDVLFWPRDWMHVAHERSTAPHATFSLSTWTITDAPTLLLPWVGRALASVEGLDQPLPPGLRFGADLPHEVDRALTALEQLARSGTLRERVTASWRERVESAGLVPGRLIPSMRGHRGELSGFVDEGRRARARADAAGEVGEAEPDGRKSPLEAFERRDAIVNLCERTPARKRGLAQEGRRGEHDVGKLARVAALALVIEISNRLFDSGPQGRRRAVAAGPVVDATNQL
jgi:hypothetical protein